MNSPNAGQENLRTLGNYLLERQLGFNGLVGSYRAVHERTADAALIVTIRSSQIANSSAWNRFEENVQAIHALANPSLCRPIDWGHDFGHFWCAYDWLEGNHLGEVVRDRGLPETAMSFHLMTEAIDALQALRNAGTSHSILNPASFFLDDQGNVRILHAAWSQFILSAQGGPANPAFLSILPFIAPEVAMTGEGDEAADVYSLGANLYFLLTGQPLHWNEDPDRLIEYIASGEIDYSALRPVLKPDEIDLVQEMLQIDPQERPVNFPALQQRLSGLAEQYAKTETPGLLKAEAPPAEPADQDFAHEDAPARGYEFPEMEEEEPLSPAPEPAPPGEQEFPPSPGQEAGPGTPPPHLEQATTQPPPNIAPHAFDAPPATPPQSPPGQGRRAAPIEDPDSYAQSAAAIAAHEAPEAASGPAPSHKKKAHKGLIIALAAGGVVILGIAAGLMLLVINLIGDRTETVLKRDLETAAGTTAPQSPAGKPPEIAAYQATVDKLSKIGHLESLYRQKYGAWTIRPEDLQEVGAELEDYKDSWGTPIDFRIRVNEAGMNEMWLVSAGKDQQWDTADDFWYHVDDNELGGYEP